MAKEMLISKTTFLRFLQCAKNAWLKLHKPEVAGNFELSDFERHLMEQGNEVESFAHNLFPGGIEVTSTGEHAVAETVRLMELRVPAIFQATAIADGFIARADVVAWNAESGKWDLFEVKGTSAVKEGDESGDTSDHITDVAFQEIVFGRAGFPLGKLHVIHLNKQCVRDGDLDPEALLEIDAGCDNARAIVPEIEPKMEAAKEYLLRKDEPKGSCDCIYYGRRHHCSTFKYSNPHVPDYSVHDLSRVSEKKLNLLVEQGILSLGDIPDEFELTDRQRNQVKVHGRTAPIVAPEEIEAELAGLKYPLYFFDYESFGPAIPAFDGYGPYKWIPFQFSLHIVLDPESEPAHVEFLHDELSDPSEKVAEMLDRFIDPKGTVIAWHKTFEAMVNRQIGERMLEYAPLMERINNQLYDLEDLFEAQHYIHAGFGGRTSIKKVLPVIAPHLSYADLDIKEGGQASDAWWRMVSPVTDAEEKTKIAKDLKTYCGLDSYAMYAIWKHLNEVVQRSKSAQISISV